MGHIQHHLMKGESEYGVEINRNEISLIGLELSGLGILRERITVGFVNG